MKMNLVLLLVSISLLTGCGKKEETIIMAEQYGLAYAPIQVAKELGFFEEFLPENVTLQYVKLANTAAIREAMLAGNLDVGFMGIPPFLIGSDKGMEWKIIMGISKSPLGLVVQDDAIQSLEDLKGKGKIALPQPGSIQHILLTMMAKATFGQADVFDEQLISMKHPDGLNALLNDSEVVGHFTSPPYLFQELDQPGTHLLVDGEEAMGGPFTFIVGVCREDFHKNEVYYNAIQQGLMKAMLYIKEHPDETVALLSKKYDMDVALIEDYLYHRGIQYEPSVVGVENFINFMYEEAYLEKKMKEAEVKW